jgi:hypothetical protein
VLNIKPGLLLRPIFGTLLAEIGGMHIKLAEIKMATQIMGAQLMI